jgi:hypothetical protein
MHTTIDDKANQNETETYKMRQQQQQATRWRPQFLLQIRQRFINSVQAGRSVKDSG